jgi:hypothetical protein
MEYVSPNYGKTALEEYREEPVCSILNSNWYTDYPIIIARSVGASNSQAIIFLILNDFNSEIRPWTQIFRDHKAGLCTEYVLLNYTF